MLSFKLHTEFAPPGASTLRCLVLLYCASRCWISSTSRHQVLVKQACVVGRSSTYCCDFLHFFPTRATGLFLSKHQYTFIALLWFLSFITPHCCTVCAPLHSFVLHPFCALCAVVCSVNDCSPCWFKGNARGGGQNQLTVG